MAWKFSILELTAGCSNRGTCMSAVCRECLYLSCCSRACLTLGHSAGNKHIVVKHYPTYHMLYCSGLHPFSAVGLLYWRPFVLDECVHFVVSSEPCTSPRLASLASLCSTVSLAAFSFEVFLPSLAVFAIHNFFHFVQQ